MAVRINKAKNFRNKAYVAVDELDNLMKSVTFSGGTIARATGNNDNDWVLNFTTADGNTPNTSSVDLTKIKDYIDNKSITVTGGNGIEIITSNASGAGSVLNPQINADIDGTTLVFTGATEGSKKISCALHIAKQTTADTGYAASYKLVDNDGTSYGDTINIIKDQFLKNAELVFGTLSGQTFTEGSNDGVAHPILKLTFAITKAEAEAQTDGSSSTATDDDKVIYVDLNELFDSYTAGNGIDATLLGSNVIQVVVDGTNVVYTAANTSASILTVDASGIHVANIQGAINYAVKNEHEKVVSTVATLNGNISSVANTTSTAVTALNTRVETVATNAAAAVNSAVADIKAIDSKVDAAIDDVNEKVESAVDAIVTNVNTAVGTTVTNVNTAVSGAIDTVNTKVNGAVSNVNTQVTALKDTVSSSIDDVNTQVTALTNKVYSTISANNTALDTVVSNVNSNVSAVVTNVNTVLKPNTSTCAVTLVEETPTIALKSGTTGVYETTVTAKYVLNVFSENGDEIYPDIVRGASPNAQGQYTFTLTADYGVAQNPIEAWKVICANDVTSVATPTDVAAPATANTVAYTNATNSVGYTDAGNGTDASYSPATAATATAVDAADAEYDTSEIANKSVANGTSATAPTAPTGATKDAPDYAGYAD